MLLNTFCSYVSTFFFPGLICFKCRIKGISCQCAMVLTGITEGHKVVGALNDSGQSFGGCERVRSAKHHMIPFANPRRLYTSKPYCTSFWTSTFFFFFFPCVFWQKIDVMSIPSRLVNKLWSSKEFFSVSVVVFLKRSAISIRMEMHCPIYFLQWSDLLKYFCKSFHQCQVISISLIWIAWTMISKY